MRIVLSIFFICLAILLPAQPFSKEDHKTVKEEGDYLNGKKNDIWKEYYKNNILKSIGEYVPAGPDRIVIVDPDKNLESMKVDTFALKIELSKTGSFKKGQWKYFYPDGKIESIENYVPFYYCRPVATLDPRTNEPILSYAKPAAELNGKQISFHYNGKIKYEAEYVYGQVNYQKYFDENGNLESEEKGGTK
jgi:antitoxin component YwqK of YwqJK toxin-antitoxin module